MGDGNGLGEDWVEHIGPDDDDDRVSRWAELVELEHVTRHRATWESISQLGLTEPEIRVKALEAAAVVSAPMLAQSTYNRPDQNAERVIDLAHHFEAYLRGHA